MLGIVQDWFTMMWNVPLLRINRMNFKWVRLFSATVGWISSHRFSIITILSLLRFPEQAVLDGQWRHGRPWTASCRHSPATPPLYPAFVPYPRCQSAGTEQGSVVSSSPTLPLRIWVAWVPLPSSTYRRLYFPQRGQILLQLFVLVLYCSISFGTRSSAWGNSLLPPCGRTLPTARYCRVYQPPLDKKRFCFTSTPSRTELSVFLRD